MQRRYVLYPGGLLWEHHGDHEGLEFSNGLEGCIGGCEHTARNHLYPGNSEPREMMELWREGLGELG